MRPGSKRPGSRLGPGSTREDLSWRLWIMSTWEPNSRDSMSEM